MQSTAVCPSSSHDRDVGDEERMMLWVISSQCSYLPSANRKVVCSPGLTTDNVRLDISCAGPTPAVAMQQPMRRFSAKGKNALEKGWRPIIIIIHSAGWAKSWTPLMNIDVRSYCTLIFPVAMVATVTEMTNTMNASHTHFISRSSQKKAASPPSPRRRIPLSRRRDERRSLPAKSSNSQPQSRT